MARPCRLLVAGLLAALALLPAAAAIFGPQSGSPCDPTSLANHVSGFCSPDMPTPQCCAPVVAVVDFGGGVPCLCRAAANPRLVVAGINTSRLLAMYSSCGGLNPAAAHFTAACQRPSSAIIDGSASSPTSGHRQASRPSSTIIDGSASSPTSGHMQTSHVLVPAADFRTTSIRPNSHIVTSLSEHLSKDERDQQDAPCNFALLAFVITESCGSNVPNSTCCGAVVTAVDISGCFCKVISEETVISSPIDGKHILFLYDACGGIRPVSNQQILDCETSGVVHTRANKSEPSVVNCTQTSPGVDGFNFTKANMVLLIIAVVLLLGLCAGFAWLLLKLFRPVGRRTDAGRVGGFSETPMNLQTNRANWLQTNRANWRLSQSEGGASHPLHAYLPYTRVDARLD